VQRPNESRKTVHAGRQGRPTARDRPPGRRGRGAVLFPARERGVFAIRFLPQGRRKGTSSSGSRVTWETSGCWFELSDLRLMSRLDTQLSKHADTKAALRSEMTKAPSAADVPGYIYTFEIRGEPESAFPTDERRIGLTLPQTNVRSWAHPPQSRACSQSHEAAGSMGRSSAGRRRGSTSFGDGGPARSKTTRGKGPSQREGCRRRGKGRIAIGWNA
jgi:hypothetical protein